MKKKHFIFKRNNVKRIILDHIISSNLLEISFKQFDCPKDIHFKNDLGLDPIDMMNIAGNIHQQFHMLGTQSENYLLQYNTLEEWVTAIINARAEKNQLLSFYSSGSLATPKIFTHSLEDLLQEVAFLSELFSEKERIISFVPSHHIYGFVYTILLPAIMNIEVLDARTIPLNSLPDHLSPNDLLVSHPYHWNYLNKKLPKLNHSIYGVSSTAPISSELVDALHQKGISITAIYGSTKTAGIAYRKNANIAYTLFPYWKRVIKNKETQLLRLGQLNTYKPSVSLPDHVQWIDEHHFFLRGRKDKMVQIAGDKVSLSKVKSVIQSHPKIEYCKVRMMRPEEGYRLKCYVSPNPGQTIKKQLLRQELEAWFKQHLSIAEQPKLIKIGKKIPRNNLGKTLDWS